MVFSSLIFLFAFLPLCLFGYYVLFGKSRKWQNYFLLLCSILFYSWGGVRYTALIVFSVAVNWLMALIISSCKEKSKTVSSKISLAAAIFFNLLILFIFKYLNFTVDNLNILLGTSISVKTIVMPIGISFFTFQGMSYVIDVFRGHGNALKNPLEVGLYISFFPQLIAGPIVRYETVADQIQNRRETTELFFSGIMRFIVGLSKKAILANTLGVISNQVFTGYCTSVLGAWLGAIAYTMQIYFDFSGYSDMAIGLGRMFGFRFEENFDRPYLSTSITVFWRRWHISMGTWFRDYVYFPLGGSRTEKKYRAYLNLGIVWLLTGIWHGANWTFILWGVLQFIVIALERLTGICKSKNPAVKVFGWIYSMFFIVMGWVLFNSATVSGAVSYIKTMFGAGVPLTDEYALYTLASSWLLLIISATCCLPLSSLVKRCFAKHEKALVICETFAAICLLVLSVAYVAKSAYSPFIYFNF